MDCKSAHLLGKDIVGVLSLVIGLGELKAAVKSGKFIETLGKLALKNGKNYLKLIAQLKNLGVHIVHKSGKTLIYAGKEAKHLIATIKDDILRLEKQLNDLINARLLGTFDEVQLITPDGRTVTTKVELWEKDGKVYMKGGKGGVNFGRLLKSYKLPTIDQRIKEVENRLARNGLIAGKLKNELYNEFIPSLGSSFNDNFEINFKARFQEYLRSKDQIVQALAQDLLEACKVLDVKDLKADQIEEVIALTKKKVGDPERYIDDLRKIKLAELTKGLSKPVDDYRTKWNKPLGDDFGGTVSFGQANLKINGNKVNIEKIGASPEARNPQMPPKANDRYINRDRSNGTVPNFPRMLNHAEQDNLGQIADDIDKVLNINKNDKSSKAMQIRESVTGKVHMYVDREVCANCTAGFNPNNTTLGSIIQFSKEFPNIEIVILAPKVNIDIKVIRKFKVKNSKLQEL